GQGRTHVLARLCPNLDRRALTCARPDHHFTSRRQVRGYGGPRHGAAGLARPSLPNLKGNGLCSAGTGHASLLRSRRGLGRLRERRRVIREAVEIDDDVRPLALARYAGEGHVGAGDIAAWIGDEVVEVVDGPGAAL